MSPGEQRFRHGLALVSFAGLIAYWALSDFFGKEIIAEIAVFAILAISLDLVAGYAGMVSLGHGALLGFGAYIFAGAAVKLAEEGHAVGPVREEPTYGVAGGAVSGDLEMPIGMGQRGQGFGDQAVGGELITGPHHPGGEDPAGHGAP